MAEQPKNAPAVPVVPDLKAPRRTIPEWVWWACGVGAVAAFGATAFYLKSQRPPETKQQLIITSSEIPDDFFKSAEKPAAPEKSDTDKEAAAATAAAAAPAKPAAPLVQTPPQRVQAKDLFTAQPVAFVPPPPPAPDPVELANEKRRSGGSAKVAKAGRLVDPSEWINSQESWDEEDQTIASYPTDLSRVVTEDRNIPALLDPAVNSELPGKVVATIEENVYGGHGRFVLIPAGSKAVGRYKALAKPGDERIMIIWHRIITPEGINIHVGNAEMADAMGRSGITGDVDNRFMDRYGMALLVSSLSALTAYQIPVTNQGQQVVVQTYGSNIASLSNQILEKNINLKPKIALPAGQRILISPQRDIWFQKPERREMQVVALEPATAKQQQGGKKR